MSSSIVPVTALAAPAIKPPTDCSLALAQLKPYRVQEVPIPGRGLVTIWEFWKVGAKPGSSMHVLRDRSVPRQLATVTYARGATTFTLAFYPNEGAPQIVVDLPMEQLAAAVADLKGAGF